MSVMFSNQHCGLRGCDGGTECVCPCSSCQRGVVAALKAEVARLQGERDAAVTRAAKASDRAADAERWVERMQTALACAAELLDDEPHLRTFDQRRRAVLTDRLRSALAEYDAQSRGDSSNAADS